MTEIFDYYPYGGGTPYFNTAFYDQGEIQNENELDGSQHLREDVHDEDGEPSSDDMSTSNADSFQWRSLKERCIAVIKPMVRDGLAGMWVGATGSAVMLSVLTAQLEFYNEEPTVATRAGTVALIAWTVYSIWESTKLLLKTDISSRHAKLGAAVGIIVRPLMMGVESMAMRRVPFAHILRDTVIAGAVGAVTEGSLLRGIRALYRRSVNW